MTSITSKPEDNTPLQAQQEEVRMEKTPFVTATSETSIEAVTQPSGSVPRRHNWTIYRNLATDLRLWIRQNDWNTSETTGSLIGNKPMLLPIDLMTQQNADDPYVNGSVVVTGFNQFTQAYMSHAMYRTGYNVYISVNGTAFNSGSLFVVAVPQPHMYLKPGTNQLPNIKKNYRIADVYNQAQLGIFPSVRLLPRTNSQAKLHLPYVGHSEWKNTATTEVDYAVFVFVETKLGISNTGSATTLKVNFEAQPESAEFMAPKRAQSIFIVPDAYQNPTSIPQPAMFEAPGERIIPGVAAIASEAPASLQRVSWKNHLQNTAYLPPRTENFHSLLSRPTIKALVDVGTSYGVGTLIADWDVSPINQIRNNNGQNLVKTIEGQTFLETFSRFFLQWTGSINYTLEWTGPAVSAGRIMIGYQPGALRESKNGSGNPQVISGSVLQAMSNGPHIIWDLSDSTSVTLQCEYALATPWAAVNPLVTSSGPFQSTENGGVLNFSTSGNVMMALMTPIVVQNTLQNTFQILIHESAGPDFNLRYFAPRGPTTLPIYNGIVDQGPPVVVQPPGQDPLDDGVLSVSQVLAHPRFMATGTVQQNETLALPLTLISYGGTDNSAKIVSGRIFPSLFTEIRADLRIIVTSDAADSILVGYRPPGSTNAVFGDVPTSTAAITNANWTMMSLRSDNVGFELFVPYPGLTNTFQTSLNTTVRADTVYNPSQDQFDPGSLGTVYVIPRSITDTNPKARVWVFVGFENVSAHVPRPFGPVNTTIPQPTLLQFEEEDLDAEYQPLGNTKKNQQKKSPIHMELEEEIYEADTMKAEFEAPLRDIAEQAWSRIYDPEDGCFRQNGCFWEISSVSTLDTEDWNEIENAENMYFEMPFPETCSWDEWENQKERKNLLDQLPDFAEGPEYPGVWYNDEWYPLVHGAERYNLTRDYPRVATRSPVLLERELFNIKCECVDFVFASLADAQRANQEIAWRLLHHLNKPLPSHIGNEVRQALAFGFKQTLSQRTFGPNFPVGGEPEIDEWEDEIVDAAFEAPLGVLPTPPVSFPSRPGGPPPKPKQSVQVPAGESESEEVDDEPPPQPYIYYVNNGLYLHWGIAYKNKAISLKQDGFNAVVLYCDDDLKKAKFHEEVGMAEWFRAKLMLGCTFPDYNVQHNCTHFVEVITNRKLRNTGNWIFAGLTAAAITTALVFQAPLKGRISVTQAEWDEGKMEEVMKHAVIERPVQTTKRGAGLFYERTRKVVTPRKRCMFFTRRGERCARFEAPIQFSVRNQAVETIASASASELSATLQTYSDMAPQLQAAVTNTAASLHDTSCKIGDFVSKLENLVEKATEFVPKGAEAMAEGASSLISDMGKKIGSVILKAVGYCLIIFGNPNPATVAGVISLMASEVLDSKFLREKIRNVAVKFSNKIQSLFLSYFGVDSCCDDPNLFEDIDQLIEQNAYLDERREQEMATFEAPPSGLTTFNQAALAAKNIEWIFDKIKELIAFVIDKLRSKQSQDPKTWLAANSQYMVQMYDDSVASGSCQGVNSELLDKRIREAGDMLTYATNNNLTTAAQLLARTVTNYQTVKRKLKAAEYEDRSEPLVVYIHGSAGVGKSVLSNMLASAYCKRKNLPFKSSVFTSPPGSEFFDGYTGQEVHIIDDFCQLTTGEDVKLFCQMVSTTRFSPPMASLEEKGVLYRSKLIIATSNLATPQSNEVRIPEALERRCYIKVRASVAPQFSQRGKLDVEAAFKNLGPAKSADFKCDCPYLNGSAVDLSVRVGMDRREKQTVYDLVDVIFEELERRESVQENFHHVIFEAPQPGDTLIYTEGVIPQLCEHHNHSSNGCNRVIFRKGSDVWVRDYGCRKIRDAALRVYWDGQIPAACPARKCPCENPDCGKVQFLSEKPQSFNFRSKSLATHFFSVNPDYTEIDPKPAVPESRSFRSVCIEKLDFSRIRKEIASLKKATAISFAITALGLISSAIAAVVFFFRKSRNSNQAPYSGSVRVNRNQNQYPRPIPSRVVNYEAPLLPQIFHKIENNVFSVKFNVPGNPFSLSALGLHGRLCVGNHHAFSRAETVEIRGRTYRVSELNVIRLMRGDKPTDLVFFTLPDGNEFKSIIRHFLSRKDRIPRADCILISRSNNVVMNIRATDIRGVKTANIFAADTGEEETFSNVITYSAPSFPGLCGAPLLSTNPSHEVVIGLHFAGTGKTGISVPIYKEDFQFFFEANLNPISHPGNPTHVARKSSLKKSPAYGVFKVTHEPAALTNKDKRLNEGIDLDKTMFAKHKSDGAAWKELEPAMSYVVEDLMYKLGFNKDDKIEMWTIEQAINGEGVMDGIDMNQSPGYPYNTQGRSRRSFFTFNGDRWFPTPELEEEVQKALENPDTFYFSTFLKDELRPIEKVKVGKTRLVDGDSLPRAIAYRMVFGPLFERMLAKHGPEIHSAVGCNPDVAWTDFFHKMGPAHYPYCFDLDYSCFDSTEPLAAFRLMGKYLQPYFSFPVEKYFEALGKSKHVYEHTAFEMEGGMPSGCVGTSMFNCINNSAFIVSALIALKIPPEEVSWLCYGDDVIISTHQKGLSKMIADYYHANTPLVVTPASKSGEFPEESTIYEVTFLKRYFQPDSAYPELIHPLMPLDHLKQSVMWRTDGPFQAKIDSLCLLAFHAGGQDYRQFVSMVDAACRRRGENYFFKPFEYHMANWYANFGL